MFQKAQATFGVTNSVIILPFNALKTQNPKLVSRQNSNILKIKESKYCRTDQTAGHNYFRTEDIKIKKMNNRKGRL